MSILSKILERSENSMLLKFKESKYPQFKEIYYCFGFENQNQNYDKFYNHLISKTLESAKLDLSYNVEQDNIEVYFCLDKFDNKFIVLLIDYFEPFDKNLFFAQFPVNYLPKIEMKKIN
jgi:signal peptidase I